MTLSNAQAKAVDAVDARMGELSDWCATLFEYGEPAWREYRSAAWYIERLRAEGFSVEEGSGGMPTAFCASWSDNLLKLYTVQSRCTCNKKRIVIGTTKCTVSSLFRDFNYSPARAVRSKDFNTSG